METASSEWSVTVGVICLLIYFLPALYAKIRGHRNYNAILALNLFLGWTVLGWIACVVWASTDNTRKAESA